MLEMLVADRRLSADRIELLMACWVLIEMLIGMLDAGC
jgi:hypothetical protein